MTALPAIVKLMTDIQSVLPDAVAVWLYGSAVSESMNAESDIDIAVFLPPTDKRKTSCLLRTEAQALKTIGAEKLIWLTFLPYRACCKKKF